MKTDTDYPQLIQQFVSDEELPASYLDDALTWFLPLKDQLLEQSRKLKPTLSIAGINGAQGTGKSTFAALLNKLLTADGLNVVNLSIDDFYHPGQKREELATTVHPLLRSRGVPGTHNLQLAFDTIDTLRTLTSIEKLVLPAFDKAHDEPFPLDECPSVHGPVDLLLLEGWFLGVQPQHNDALADPINDLEATEDKEKFWRTFVNTQLGMEYQSLFASLDFLIMLKAPNFEQVYEWRTKQEHKLRRRAESGSSIMNDAELVRFIQHFERLTRHSLATVPERANVVVHLDSNHRVTKTS